MAHDVFISYSSRDKAVADAVCANLENRKIRCWIAPRDVLPGQVYAEALMDGLNQSRLIVLVFSENSNTSPQVLREVERAVHRGIPIIPFRIEDVVPSKAMEYFVSSSHWLDALTPPLEMHLQRLADTVQVLLSGGNTSLAEMVTSATTTTTIQVKPRNKALPLFLGVGSAIVVLAVIGVIFLTGGFGRRISVPNQTLPTVTSAPVTTSATPTVKLPSASLPAPIAKGLLYEDNFDDPSSGWNKISDQGEDSNYENGEFSLTQNKPNWGFFVVNPNTARFADMALEIDTTLIGGPSQSGYDGVIFRAQNNDNFYRFLVSGQGEFRIDKRVGGITHFLKKPTKSPFINQGNATNHLKVVCKGTQMGLECNGNLLASITDDSFSEGFVGLAVASGDSPVTAHFDNLRIYNGN
jgi:hypothetical protein